MVSDVGDTPPGIFNPDYTHPVVLPTPLAGFDLLMFGADGVPHFLNSNTGAWLVGHSGRPGTLPDEGPNVGASSALLPVRLESGEWGYANGSMLIAGGDHHTSHQGRIDVYDPVADTWRPRIRVRARRHHPTATLLPDGRVAVVAGHAANGAVTLRRASYVDPAQDFELQLGSSSTRETRGYHNVSLLLPDGRVLVGGGQDDVTGQQAEKADFRYLYPSYMFEDRPEIVAAPETMNLATEYPLISAGEEPAEVVLMGLGSMTHSFDFNQRYVQLELISTEEQGGLHVSSVRGPANAATAPPGMYMLFVLDAERVPSVARIVRLQ